MGKVLKILLAVVILAVGLSLAGELLTDSDTQIPVISDLLQSIHFDTGEKKFHIDMEPFYEIEDTDLFEEDEEILENQAVNLSYEGEAFMSVSLQISQVNLTVGTAPENTLYVETEEVSRYQAYVEDEVLYIIIEGTLSAQNAVEGESLLPEATILLPSEDTAGETALNLEVLAGSVSVEQLETDSLELKLSAGTVSLQDLRAGQLTVTMLAGSLSGQDLKVTETTLVTMSAGSMSLSGDLSAEVTAQVTAGNLTLVLEQPYENYDCQITCAAGSVTVAGVSYSGLTAAENIRHGGANTLTVDCSVGVVEVAFSESE